MIQNSNLFQVVLLSKPFPFLCICGILVLVSSQGRAWCLLRACVSNTKPVGKIQPTRPFHMTLAPLLLWYLNLLPHLVSAVGCKEEDRNHPTDLAPLCEVAAPPYLLWFQNSADFSSWLQPSADPPPPDLHFLLPSSIPFHPCSRKR